MILSIPTKNILLSEIPIGILSNLFIHFGKRLLHFIEPSNLWIKLFLSTYSDLRFLSSASYIFHYTSPIRAFLVSYLRISFFLKQLQMVLVFLIGVSTCSLLKCKKLLFVCWSCILWSWWTHLLVLHFFCRLSGIFYTYDHILGKQEQSHFSFSNLYVCPFFPSCAGWDFQHYAV